MVSGIKLYPKPLFIITFIDSLKEDIKLLFIESLDGVRHCSEYSVFPVSVTETTLHLPYSNAFLDPSPKDLVKIIDVLFIEKYINKFYIVLIDIKLIYFNWNHDLLIFVNFLNIIHFLRIDLVGSESLCPFRICPEICLEISKVIVLEGRAFTKWLGHEGEALINKSSALIKENTQSSHAPSVLWG